MMPISRRIGHNEVWCPELFNILKNVPMSRTNPQKCSFKKILQKKEDFKKFVRLFA